MRQSHYLTLTNGYDRTGKERLSFRTPASIAEMIDHCNRTPRIWFVCNDGKARQATVNGRVRTWKRDASRIEIPLKYGMYEYFTFTAYDIDRVLIPVPAASVETSTEGK